MITLKIEDRCHGCPAFEVDHIHIGGSVDHTIKCKHAYQCQMIKEYLETHTEKDDKNA